MKKPTDKVYNHAAMVCVTCGKQDVYISFIKDGEITRRYCQEHTTHRHWYEKAILEYQAKNAGFSFVPKSKQDVEELLEVLRTKLGRMSRVMPKPDPIDYNEAELLAGRKAV